MWWAHVVVLMWWCSCGWEFGGAHVVGAHAESAFLGGNHAIHGCLEARADLVLADVPKAASRGSGGAESIPRRLTHGRMASARFLAASIGAFFNAQRIT